MIASPQPTPEISIDEPARLSRAFEAATAQLQAAQAEIAMLRARLERSGQELQATHSLTAALQSTQDITRIQEQTLALITGELGFERAILALADPLDGALTHWRRATRSRADEPRQFLNARLPIDPAGGHVAQAILEGRPRLAPLEQHPTSDASLNAWIGPGCYAVLPMAMRGRLLGALLVEGPADGRAIDEDDLLSLANIARHAAMVIGSVQLCIARTQRLAVEEERNRIAMEIHDAISQQLYGITYTLDACVRVLPERAGEVREQLAYLLPQAQQATAAIRRAIFDLWPDELDAARFASALRAYAQDIAPAGDLLVDARIDACFDALPLDARKQLYRIAQEALTNIVRHAGARNARIALLAGGSELRLTIADDGCGFTPGEEREHPHFGLVSMRERAEALGGRLHMQSLPGQGTLVTVTLPKR